MNLHTLRQLYNDHKGKVSDKWSFYLDTYDEVFPTFRNQELKLLEIGIQNGGSLEIWSKYFPYADLLLGCDIDEACSMLRYDDPRIQVVVGDANTDATQVEILKRSPQFDIVLDDGSHRSGDIVSSFARYFPYLKDGGLYVAEDLHCSYWKGFGGGLSAPHSSINFFKRLADIVNFEHWGTDGERSDLLRPFVEAYGCAFAGAELAQVYSVEFRNSVCFVRKRTAARATLGRRIVTGKDAQVFPLVLSLDGQLLSDQYAPDETDNEWSDLKCLPEVELIRLREAYPAIVAEAKMQKAAFDAMAEETKRQKAEFDAMAEETRRVSARLRHQGTQLEATRLELRETRFARARIEAELNERLRSIHSRADQDRASASHYQQLAEATLASNSWRITAPLRRLSSWVDRQRDRTRTLCRALHPNKIMTLRETFDGVDTSSWRELNGSKGYDATLAEQAASEAKLQVKSDTRGTIYYSHKEYQAWVQTYDTLDGTKRKLIRNSIGRLAQLPLLSIVLLPSTTGGEHQEPWLLESLLHQLYVQWELLLPESSNLSLGNPDPRIRTIRDSSTKDLAPVFNAALEVAQGDFVLPLPADARLAEHALYELAVAISGDPEADLLYSDEDRIDGTGQRCNPSFKTGWDPDLALARDSIGLLAAYRVSLLRSLGGMRQHGDRLGPALYELSLRIAFAASSAHIHHIPTVLCHRKADTAFQDQDAEDMRAIVHAHLEGSGVNASVNPGPGARLWLSVVREVPKPEPLVSIIVPTRDRADLLEPCAASLLSNTDYPALELLIVDNDTQDAAAIALLRRLSLHRYVRVLPYPGKFNYAAINNFAASEAQGEILVLLNNDTESIRPDWLRAMVAHAVRADVGAVGARLLYADGRIQHAGMVNQPDGPVHQFRFAGRYDTGPMGELCLARSVTMVTGACLAIRRAVYFEVGGLDEDLRVAFNDVDLCMKLGDKGYRVVWTPDAELFHYESASRGYDVTPEKQALAAREFEHFKRRWGSLLCNDPFRNPNLNYGWDRITLATPPQRPPSWQLHAAFGA